MASLIMDIIYPPQNKCLNCNIVIKRKEIRGICADCLSKIDFVLNYCNVCGRELESSLCKDCEERLPAFDRARSVAVYQGIIRDLILQFKYYDRSDLVIPLSDLLTLYFCEYYVNLSIDYIVPIPLHEKRKKERGYNQAGLLAQELEKEIKIPVLSNYLLRVKNTCPLYNLNLSERRQTLKGGFKLKKDNVCKQKVRDSTILLIDDIFTTGTTVNEASLVLKDKGGVGHVYVLTLATASLCDSS